ncbi:MAG: ATP synthase F1 subunit gamma [Actinomycetota bacterium]
MQKLIELKQRMKTVQNIETITRTLATVSAAKLSRTRRRAAGLREYTQKIREILYDQQKYMAKTGLSLAAFSPLLEEKGKVNKVALFLIAADRGMCGNYNLAAARLGLDFWERRKSAGQKVLFIVKGRKAERYLKKRKANIIHKEGWRREGVLPKDVERILTLLIDLYLTGEADEVYTVYTQFYSPIRRRPLVTRLLPIKLQVKEKSRKEETEKWFYEPSFREIIDELLSIYLRVQLFDVLLESFASEQGARMITMEEATERAEKTLKECRMMYNRLRREVITIDLLSVLFASKVVEETAATPGRLA